MNIAQANKKITQIIDNASEIILGKRHQLTLAVACFLAKGHLLVEDLPGMGKTTLAHVLARTLGLEFKRIQFTSDMLPADILGTTIYQNHNQAFRFMPGPIFSQLVLADEVNRATPKTQSALLEAMEEYQVTIEGDTHPLPKPFFVIATQNPSHQIGTFTLPESQLDRFLMRIKIGYPDELAEKSLLQGRDRRAMIDDLTPVASTEDLLAMQSFISQIHTSDALIDYVHALLTFSREAYFYHTGLSPRAGLALIRASQAWALVHARDHVLPEDVQAVLPNVVGHRLQASTDYRDQTLEDLLQHIQHVAIP